jgi:hypothetical protein
VYELIVTKDRSRGCPLGVVAPLQKRKALSVLASTQESVIVMDWSGPSAKQLSASSKDVQTRPVFVQVTASNSSGADVDCVPSQNPGGTVFVGSGTDLHVEKGSGIICAFPSQSSLHCVVVSAVPHRVALGIDTGVDHVAQPPVFRSLAMQSERVTLQMTGFVVGTLTHGGFGATPQSVLIGPEHVAAPIRAATLVPIMPA